MQVLALFIKRLKAEVFTCLSKASCKTHRVKLDFRSIGLQYYCSFVRLLGNIA